MDGKFRQIITRLVPFGPLRVASLAHFLSKDINTKKQIPTTQYKSRSPLSQSCRSQRSSCQPVSSGSFAPSASSLTALKQHVTHVRITYCKDADPVPCPALPYPAPLSGATASLVQPFPGFAPRHHACAHSIMRTSKTRQLGGG